MSERFQKMLAVSETALDLMIREEAVKIGTVMPFFGVTGGDVEDGMRGGGEERGEQGGKGKTGGGGLSGTGSQCFVYGGNVIDLTGKTHSGKTEMLMDVALNAIVDDRRGRRVVWVDTGE
eukprot:TRINITY_DN1601_c1_g1_i1.p1 TRINITY_DN1601_c1_g1~~TRINITY_DN1601_c1_g1_i1.p1  ORF type:complete len:120 (+),score=23.59 TRINITY_DN1601_c1_g1_i1:556-915(+)